jgi:hypothetical protein
MPVPSKEQLEIIAKDFYRCWKFPNCIGCIDGKHCQLKCPVNVKSRHFNYLKYFSVVLQGVADADKEFITIKVGARGKKSDRGKVSSLTLFQLLQKMNSVHHLIKNCLVQTSNYCLHVLIGNEAYLLKVFLMSPFPNRDLNPVKENCNKRLSAARKFIDCAFGTLRAEWWIFGKDTEVNPQRAVSIINCVHAYFTMLYEKEMGIVI